MFEEKEQQDQELSETKDIFSETEKNNEEPLKESNEVFDFEEEKTPLLKRVIIMIVGILIIGGIAYGAYWGYGKIKQSKKEIVTPAGNNENINQEKQTEINIPSLPQDTDGDGLMDNEEIKLGTDPERVDTDGDGLSDREEVKVYKTDPLKPDTDGDGYLDGQEVRYNYDPLNPAKGAMLRDLKTEIEKIK